MSNVATCRRTGDILLFRPTSIMGYIAAMFTWSRYSHAALVSVEDGVTYYLEVREFSGGRTIELEKYLKEEPSTVEGVHFHSVAGFVFSYPIVNKQLTEIVLFFTAKTEGDSTLKTKMP